MLFDTKLLHDASSMMKNMFICTYISNCAFFNIISAALNRQKDVVEVVTDTRTLHERDGGKASSG